jgi:FKBP-type peptidyl-prolyl cis-trans isomerase 2
MTQVKNGDTIKVHYVGKLEDGTIFETSTNRDPLEYTVGSSKVFPVFDQAVIGMQEGELKTLEIPVERAFGHRDERKVVTLKREQLPPDLEPQVGQRLQIRQKDDKPLRVTVATVSDSIVTLDANHPLAGKDLTLDVQVVEILRHD